MISNVRMWFVGMTWAGLLLLPQLVWGQGEQARVGVKTVGNLEIALYAWGPQEVIHPKKEDVRHEAGEPATHHLDVRIYDLGRRIYIPYLNIKATITELTKRREFSVALEPMIGEWIHYGANSTLPHRGTHSILIDIQPPDIARFKHAADVWNTPVQTVFTFEYR